MNNWQPTVPHNSVSMHLPVAKGKGAVVRFMLQLKQPLVVILLAASLITLILAEYVDAGVIFAVVIVNALIGFIQEDKAMKAIEALSHALTSEATVIRDGEKKRIAAVQIVPGDIVLLQSGDKVPADLRLIRIRELQIDESALTGKESVPVQKEECVLGEDMVIGDRRNMAYASTLVTYGSGRGIVVANGDNTEIGRINQLITGAEVLETPLTRKIHHFSGILLYAISGHGCLDLCNRLGARPGYSGDIHGFGGVGSRRHPRGPCLRPLPSRWPLVCHGWPSEMPLFVSFPQ